MWTACANSSPNCSLQRMIRLPLFTLVQCWWRFRAWRRTVSMPLRQFHSDSHNLANDLGLLGMAQNSNRNRRQRMRLKNHVVATHAAPAASVSVASFHKIDRAFIFRAPRTLHYLILCFIDLDEAAGRKNRIHGEILVPD